MEDAESAIRFELKNTKPVDLIDLTGALSAFGEAFQDYVVSAGFDTTPGNVRLFVREIKTGSVIADLVSQAEQVSLVLKHIEVAAGFLTHFNELVQFFLGVVRPKAEPEPTRREAEQVMRILEPVAKDFGSQVFLNVSGGMHVHHHYDSRQANAVQNAARRFLGPAIPSSEIRTDQLLRLYQVRGVAKAKVGDLGVIEEITRVPVKLIFASEEAKRRVLDVPFPFERLFLVDVEVKATGGKVAAYRILTVKEDFPLP